MKAKQEFREERTDIFGFYVKREIIGIDGIVTIEEKVEETTELALLEKRQQLESELLDVNNKLQLINEICK